MSDLGQPGISSVQLFRTLRSKEGKGIGVFLLLALLLSLSVFTWVGCSRHGIGESTKPTVFVELPTPGNRTEVEPSYSQLLLVEVYGEMSGRFLLPDDNSVQASQVIQLCVRNPFGYLKKVRLHRLDPQTGKITNRFLNIDKALREGDESDNIILQGGDRLEIQTRHYPWSRN